MKKITAILLTAALLAALTGCGKTEENSHSVQSSDNGSSPIVPSGTESTNGSQIKDGSESKNGSESTEDGAPESSDDSESVPDVPENRQPEGEPTFLIGLDGEPIYTSEITQMTAYSGNIADIDSGLREGDLYVKVRVVVGDIVCGDGSSAVIREIELI